LTGLAELELEVDLDGDCQTGLIADELAALAESGDEPVVSVTAVEDTGGDGPTLAVTAIALVGVDCASDAAGSTGDSAASGSRDPE
ncbi:MAG: hypothetical protein M3386_05545, partial [Actinomycetota bacterium]|nr:hypothetical protein [Actinomycetota bacterium]